MSITQYDKMIHGIIRKYNIQGYEYQDLLQEGYLAACKAVNTHREGNTKLSTYVHTVVNNRMKTLYTTGIRRKIETVSTDQNIHEDMCIDDILTCNSVDPLDMSIYRERIDIIKRHVNTDLVDKMIMCTYTKKELRDYTKQVNTLKKKAVI